MPDGTSGLSLSEMGISAVKKTAQVVKKHAGGVGGQVKQQMGGTFVPSQNQPQLPVRSNDNPLSKIGGGSFDIASFGKTANQQLSGSGNVSANTFLPGKMPQAANPPSEVSPKQAGGFDLGSLFGEKNPLGKSSNPKQSSSQQVIDPQIETQLQQQKAKDQQQMEALRKKLHDIYFEEFIRKSEGKNEEKNEEEKKQKEMQEQQEEEEKKRQKEREMEPVELSQSPQKGMPGLKQKKKNGFSFLKLLRPKMGSHEGRAGKG